MAAPMATATIEVAIQSATRLVNPPALCLGSASASRRALLAAALGIEVSAVECTFALFDVTVLQLTSTSPLSSQWHHGAPAVDRWHRLVPAVLHFPRVGTWWNRGGAWVGQVAGPTNLPVSFVPPRRPSSRDNVSSWFRGWPRSAVSPGCVGSALSWIMSSLALPSPSPPLVFRRGPGHRREGDWGPGRGRRQDDDPADSGRQGRRAAGQPSAVGRSPRPRRLAHHRRTAT